MVRMLSPVLAVVLVAGAGTLHAAPGDEDLRATVRALQQRVAELEAQQKDSASREHALRRQAVMEVLEEMKLDVHRQDNDFRVYWLDGLRFDSADGNFRLRIGGRVHNDWWWITGGGVERNLGTDLQDGARFRRARINIQGEIYRDVIFKTQYDFADGSASFKDVYMGMKNVPWLGTVRVGQFKEAFSLEELTSSNYITFLERSLANVFAPARNVGVAAGNTALDKRMTWAVGVFRDADNQGVSESDGGYNLTYRLTGLPVYEDGGNTLVHVGFAHSLRTPKDDIRYRQRPEVRVAQRFVDTTAFEADRVNLLGVEAAAVHGPFSIQSEYVTALVDSGDAGDPHFHGVYVQAGYFLTGETRPYSTSSGAFGRVKPKANFRQEGGWGALEAAARYSYLDLTDGNVRGGRVQNGTVGLNWYLNPNVRVMSNYIRSCVDGDWSGAADIFAMRFQVDF